MAIGKRNKPTQQPLWIPTNDLVPRSGYPFYTRLNNLLNEDGFGFRQWHSKRDGRCLETGLCRYIDRINRPIIQSQHVLKNVYGEYSRSSSEVLGYINCLRLASLGSVLFQRVDRVIDNE